MYDSDYLSGDENIVKKAQEFMTKYTIFFLGLAGMNTIREQSETKRRKVTHGEILPFLPPTMLREPPEFEETAPSALSESNFDNNLGETVDMAEKTDTRTPAGENERRSVFYLKRMQFFL